MRSTTNVTIFGDYIQESSDSGTSNLVFTIFEENNHSKLNITGTATFFGLLTVQSDSNMEFELNQSFKLINAGTIEGAFSSLSLPSF